MPKPGLLDFVPQALGGSVADRSAHLAISASGLRKVYRTGFWMREHVVLDQLDVAVPRGEIFGFIGPNGAGKTTTIKILMGLHRATSGEATIFGVDHRDPTSRARVGFLPERPYFYQHLTARELLRFYGELMSLSDDTVRTRSEELLERVDLRRFADVPLGSYSKGMLQRVGLCQTLLHDPELIVLDEPMSGLDPLGRALVRDLILEERERGCTVFFSSHILHDVETLSDRVALLVHGRLRGVGSLADLVGGGMRYVEVRLASLPAEVAAMVDRQPSADEVVVQVAPDLADAVLAKAVGVGVSVRSVTPVRQTLEALLLDEVERARPVDEKKLGVLA
jgi:ABC-2 type transport system ATP-binding protein